MLFLSNVVLLIETPEFRMSQSRTFSLTLLAMIAFAGNSLLCRQALKQTGIDAASFTSVRILSGALVLWLITQWRGGRHFSAGSWPSALALFVYAAGFSYAYLTLSAATGALLLFGAVQSTMIGHGLWRGERFHARQSAGLVLAFAGLGVLLLPGLSAPPLFGSLLMLAAGVAWGVYCLRGKGAIEPTSVTAGNFLRAVPMALLVSALTHPQQALPPAGIWYGVCSGALASGLGYAVWYMALRGLKATSAATVQLSVPPLAALGAVVFLGEAVTFRLLCASVAILGGIALVIVKNAAPVPATATTSSPRHCKN
ncbi:DMT family transporter [Geomonas sp.]|uniref:DMT family transporter n=1 Tax=Geomonas sp. TaxID=2651584 RepID=UPI002B49DEC6|nr:DMT family transporter [Geomonas sp.]HJV34484.1 DMT family transporter [Geomonas sp.]